MKIIDTKVFQYDELDEKAKEKAREWYTSSGLHDDWWEGVYEMAEIAAKLIGIELKYRSAKNMKGEPIQGQPCIWFSGFSSQGDGACFEGQYSYAKGSTKSIRAEFPQDTELHAIVDGLQHVQRGCFYRLRASVTHRGHYYHSLCTDIDVYDSEDQYKALPDGVEDTVKELLRDFMHWIYRALEREHDYLLSDEQVADSIKANGYEFTEDGRHFT